MLNKPTTGKFRLIYTLQRIDVEEYVIYMTKKYFYRLFFNKLIPRSGKGELPKT